MKKLLFIALALLGSCIAEQSMRAEEQPQDEDQLINSISQDGTEVDISQFTEEEVALLKKKAVWVNAFRKAKAGEINIDVFIYVTLELMEELGKSTNQEDREMYDLCEKIVKSITEAMNQSTDKAEETSEEQASIASVAPAA